MIAKESGIYKIENIITGDFYIGSAANLYSRLSTHRGNLGRNCHANIHLQRAWNKYEVDNFEFSVVEYCEKEITIIREQFYINLLKPKYNICKVAGNCLGRITSEETKRKIGESHKGKRLGKLHTEETRAKISASLMGNTNSLGHKHTEETKQILSEANKGKLGNRLGKHQTEETRAKISVARIGTHPTKESCAKMSEAHMGTHPSDVTRAKLSEAAKKTWMLRREAKTSIRTPYD